MCIFNTIKCPQLPAMRQVLVEDPVVVLAAEVPREARVPGVRPGLDHVPDQRPGESSFLAYSVECILTCSVHM